MRGILLYPSKCLGKHQVIRGLAFIVPSALENVNRISNLQFRATIFQEKYEIQRVKEYKKAES